MRNANWKWRNRCAIGILGLYFLVNAIAIGFYHFASPIQVDHNQGIVIEILLFLGSALTVLFFATAWFWARAKNWPGFIGAIAALGGAILWLGCAAAVIAPHIGKETPGSAPSVPVDNWLPLLPWVAFTFTVVILKVMPVRKAVVAPMSDAA